MNSHPPTDHRADWAFLLVFALLAAGLITASYFYQRSNEQNYRAEVERQLSAIADLKVGELTLWRKERLGDGSILFKNDAFAALARRFLEHPTDADAQRQLLDWLEKFSVYGQYDRVWLLDPQGVTRLSLPAGQPPTTSATLQRTAEVLRSGQTTFQDFYRNEHDHRVYLAVLIPILGESDGSPPLGVLVLRIDPEKYLYPFINRWPMLSRTAETLLVRREGNEVLFLNELRFQTNTALNLRIPLDRVTIPAVQAALGREGVIEGVDYQGVQVVAVTRSIPGSPWALVARMNIAEVNGPVRERFWQLIVLIGALLLGLGSCLGFVWRQQHVRLYRAQAETAKALLREQTFVRALMDNLADGVVACEAAGKLVLFNRTAREWHGLDALALPPEEWGLHYDLYGPDGITPLPTDAIPLLRAFRGETVREAGMTIVAKDQAPRHILAAACPFFDDQHNLLGAVAVMRDITERKRAEEKIAHTLAELERSNKELELFAYVASHDLQEPLRMVSSYTQLLARRYEGQLDDKARKYIHYAVDGAARMQTLIDDLLAYSRVGARSKPLETIASSSPLDKARRNLAARIKETAAVITNDELPTVRADPAQLLLVFQNLLSNALKFHRADSPSVHVAAQDRGSEWMFSVKDNGIGIEPQHAERIFVIFQRLHTREEYPGTGIGLAICKRIVERHGGKIWLESEPGKGATFFFTIPK